MKRILWTLLFVGACIGWLVLSYRPEFLVGTTITTNPAVAPYFAWFFAGSALLFVFIQLLLVVRVRTFPTRISRGGQGQDEFVPVSEQEIQINTGAEFFWTALPLGISLVLFLVVWRFLPGL